MSRKDDPSRDASDRKKAELGARIQARREAREAKQRKAEPKAWSRGVKYGSEFFAGVITGAALGYLLDLAAGVSPWGLIGGVMLGFVAGTYNIVRAANELNATDAGDGGSKQ